MITLKYGDILLTRNTDDNYTPGYWNHASIVTYNGVVEAQTAPFNKVIVSVEGEFIRRYPEILLVRYKDALVAAKASKFAIDSIGKGYRKIASLFYFLRKPSDGENCVSVVRRAWKKALKKDPGWKIPDDITKHMDGFSSQYIKTEKNGI
jgi:hypothetical protein